MHSNFPGVMFLDVSVHTSLSSFFVKFALMFVQKRKSGDLTFGGAGGNEIREFLANKNLDNLHLELLGLFSEMAALQHII